MAEKQVRTREGAIRRYDAVYRRYVRENSGGGMFGFDWPTLRVNSPETYAELRRLIGLANTLPSRKKGA